MVPGRLAVRFSHVDFSYATATKVLSNVSLEIPAGRTMAIVGPSGSGKSTISRLLWRAYDPDAGQITINDIPVQELSLDALRDGIGVVAQDTYLLGTTIRDNVTMLDSTIGDEKVNEALAAVGLRRWVKALAQGLDTQVVDGGGSLSTGQLHLISMARVLVRDPQVVVLDEITAHLDPVTERIVAAATRQLLLGRTGLVITHKDRGLDEADFVTVMRAGRVRWSGPRAELPPELEAEVLKNAALG